MGSARDVSSVERACNRCSVAERRMSLGIGFGERRKERWSSLSWLAFPCLLCCCILRGCLLMLEAGIQG